MDERTKPDETSGQSETAGKTDWGKLALGVAKGAGKITLAAGKLAFHGIAAAADGIDKVMSEQADNGSRQGTRRANIAATLLMEEVFVHFKQRIWVNPQFAWRQIQPIESYMQLVFTAGWQLESNTVGMASFTPTTQMQLDLRFEQQVDGSTIIHYEYKVLANSLIQTDRRADDLINLTNKDIKAICGRHPMPAGGA